MTSPERVDGIDISHYQSGKLDIAGAKRRGLKWLYHKATEGSTVKDSMYNHRRGEAQRAGIPFGAYHFARPEGPDARIEAKAFLAYAKPQPGDLRPVLDLEVTGSLGWAALINWADQWCDVVRKETGAEPILYTPYDLGKAQENRLLWRPRYNNSNTPPNLPWDIWQFSDGVYGVPNSYAGFGHVDLNVMRPGLEVNDMLIPRHRDPQGKGPKPERKTRNLRFAHCSMQFKDSPAQMKHDVEVLFSRRNHIITGTEAFMSADPLASLLRSVGREHGYRVAVYPGRNDSWVAVDKDIIDGNWSSGLIPILKSGKALGSSRSFSPKGLTTVSFDSPFGTIGVGAAHYLTGGSVPGAKSQHGKVNHYELNKQMARVIGDWADAAAKGRALAFYGGDQNIVDAKYDTFFGENLTSVWDELGRWLGTGHGNIDVIASHDRDKRVTAKRVRVFKDNRVFLYTDHFLVEAVFEVVL